MWCYLVLLFWIIHGYKLFEVIKSQEKLHEIFSFTLLLSSLCICLEVQIMKINILTLVICFYIWIYLLPSNKWDTLLHKSLPHNVAMSVLKYLTFAKVFIFLQNDIKNMALPPEHWICNPRTFIMGP